MEPVLGASTNYTLPLGKERAMIGGAASMQTSWYARTDEYDGPVTMEVMFD